MSAIQEKAPSAVWQNQITARPAVDIVGQESEVVILLEMPGTSAGSIELSVEKNILTARAEAERPEGFRQISDLQPGRAGYQARNYSRSFELGDDLDPQGIEASYADGVLQIKIPRIKKVNRKIEVRAV